VPPKWLRRQSDYAAGGIDVVAGTVAVTDWSAWPPELWLHYDRTDGWTKVLLPSGRLHETSQLEPAAGESSSRSAKPKILDEPLVNACSVG
jgi:hypothetical protein